MTLTGPVEQAPGTARVPGREWIPTRPVNVIVVLAGQPDVALSSRNPARACACSAVAG